MHPFAGLFLLLVALAGSVRSAPLQLDAMTWPEVRDALKAGSTTILIPIGGTEQNGPHMALGKHNFRVAVLAERIAERLGGTLVAPVLAYVPEPPGHMRFPGTISVPSGAFLAVVEGAARSLHRHGFRDIVLVGDSGDYQPLLRRLGDKLNREWAGTPFRVHYAAAYYAPAPHAGREDTARLLALAPSHVRLPQLKEASPDTGAAEDPSGATAEQGSESVERIVEATVRSLREAIGRPR
jgi:creatinine amidohydrolase